MSKADHVQSTSSVNRRSILAGAAGIAAAGALPTSGHASSVIEPSAEFHEVVRTVALIRARWEQEAETLAAEDVRAAEVAKLEETLHAIETRLASRSATPSDLLTRAALVLYWSFAWTYSPGARGFDEPATALKRFAKDEKGCPSDTFERHALHLAAAVFEAAGLPQERRA